ncbi:MAG: hypothetical protein MZW92_51640 [Comamonadaceae bacterium]|nr:hypothetical protein [Comamonadaceae bacterium]
MPEDEVAAAFYDRFLVRMELGPVSAAAFFDLVRLAAGTRPVRTRARCASDATNCSAWPPPDAVVLPEVVLHLLADLRAHLGTQDTYVSDRRWRKLVKLLKTAALTDGRDRVTVWDVWLAQFCSRTAARAAAGGGASGMRHDSEPGAPSIPNACNG